MRKKETDCIEDDTTKCGTLSGTLSYPMTASGKVLQLQSRPALQKRALPNSQLPDTVLSVYDLVSSSDLNKRIYIFKRV